MNKGNLLGGWAGLAGMTDEMSQYDTPLSNHKLGVGLLGLMKAMGPEQANSIFGFLPDGWIPDFTQPGGGSGGGTTSPPPPPPGPAPTPRWSFPEYTQNWAFTPPDPFYTAPPPVFDKKNYPTTTTTKK